MIRKNILLLFSSIVGIVSAGQNNGKLTEKPVITPVVFGKFLSVPGALLSNDGNYVTYSVNDPTAGTSTTYLQFIHSNWKLNIGSSICQFTNNSRYAVFWNNKDSLTVFNLNSKEREYILDVISFKQSSKWLAYQLKPSRKLILRSFETGKEITFEFINSYYFNNEGNALLLETTENGIQSLQWVDPESSKTLTIWTSDSINIKAGNFVFSKSGSLAFIVENKTGKAIWYYQQQSNKAVELANQSSPGIGREVSLNDIDYRGFTEDGRKIFITLMEKEEENPNPDAAKVDVWSYTDAELQSQQLKQLGLKSFIAILHIDDKQIIRLEQENEKMISSSNDYAIVSQIKGFGYEWSWNKCFESHIYLVSLKDAGKKLINNGFLDRLGNFYWFSPQGKYVIYYDPVKKNYYSYEVDSGLKRNITSTINATWTTYIKRDVPMARYIPIYSGMAGWLKDDKAVLLYDQYDIYQVDPSGKNVPINLTNGLGKKQNIEFRMAIEKNQIFDGNEKLIVSAFNRNTKDDGFYSIQLGKKSSPELLTMQPYMFKGTWEDDRFIPVYPLKAKDAELYLIRRMSAEESPNYFWTSDFRKFNQLTDVHPERNYNWLTTQLITWKTANGNLSQGILYKPQNFDPEKKYPLIFYYYENLTEGLHGFLMPDITHGTLNIPYYVSNGYLVFAPDMHYKLGHPGQSVVNTVVSAANYLSKLPFVDAKHMGIQGHSRGGWETNFLITHTHIFAAAMSSSGLTDYVSLYNGIRSLAEGNSRQISFEFGYQRIGATLWERPDLFFENSPALKADEVTTPLLMMANKEDNDIPFEQGVEFFTALRRLGKRSWMLQYDGQGHLVFDKAAEDLEIRMKQFFDHYLKGARAPKWMLDGIPASRKGIDDGLELDTTGRKPGPGLLKK